MRSIIIALCAALLLACAPSTDITSWRLAPNEVPATLPGNIAPLLHSRGAPIRLDADVDVPPELRHRDASLSISVQWCSPKLTVDGAPIDDAERSVLDGERSTGPHLYRIPAERMREHVKLGLEIADTYEYCALFEVAPNLAAGDFGSASYQVVRTSNLVTPLLEMCGFGLLAPAILILYFVGGRRRAHLDAAIGCLLLIGHPATFIGFPHRVIGFWGDAFYNMCALPAALFFARFAHDYYAHRPLSRAWTIAVACCVCAIPLSMRRYSLEAMWMIGNLMGFALYFRMLATTVRYRRERNAVLLLVAISSVMPLGLIDNVALFGVHLPTAGMHPAYLGFLIVAFAMFVAFMRDFGAANLELRAQADELRHQVAERSRQLQETLVRADVLVPSAPVVGDLVGGRYRVLRELGAGGMGAVYEVERDSDHGRFALKVITGQVRGEHAARFAREAEIGARLKHPNLVPILDVGIARGTTPFLVMELVDGTSLEAERVRFGDAAWALPILQQIARGLVALHENGVVHRDLKPGNVLLTGEAAAPTARISDFGISRFGSADLDPVGATMDAAANQKLTGTGAVMGTPLYMAPEAGHGRAGPPADVFAFGIIAYELLMSRPPFAMPPVILGLAGQLPDAPPLDASVSTRTRETIAACLRMRPNERPSAHALLEVLSLG